MHELKGAVIGAAIEVHRTLGPGLLENAYRDCLAWELRRSGLRVEAETTLPLKYKTLEVQNGYRLDLLVEGRLIVELKAIAELLPIHEAQLRTYLRMFGQPEGLLINFNVQILKAGIRRVMVRPSIQRNQEPQRPIAATRQTTRPVPPTPPRHSRAEDGPTP